MIKRFIDYMSAERRCSPLTVRNYRHDLEGFVEWYCESNGVAAADFDWRNITSEDISRRIYYRMDEVRVKPASMNRELSSLRSFFRFLRKCKVVDKDIFILIKPLKTPRLLPTFVPETRMSEVVENMREQSHSSDTAELRDSLIMSLLYGCGLRLAELRAIRCCDIADDGSNIKIRGKGDKERMVPLQAEIASRISYYMATMRSEGINFERETPLFVTKNGKVLSRSTIERVVGRELMAAGVQGRKSPHVLRHTFATQLLNHDADMRDIQELMGHSSLKTTQHYTHNSITKLQEVYAKAHPHG